VAGIRGVASLARVARPLAALHIGAVARPPARYRIEFADVTAALPDLLLAGTFVLVWLRPDIPVLPSVKRLVMTVLLEFFIIHSAGFMGALAYSDKRQRKATVFILLALGGFYTLFLAGFSFAFDDWWLLASFYGLMANRLLGVVLGQAPNEKRQSFVMLTWAFTVAAFLGAVAFGAAGNLPRYGITDTVIKQQGFTVGGLWTESPHTALAAGAIYFTLVGLFELLIPPFAFRRERAFSGDMRESLLAAEP
jgi:hypothetical protein